MSWLLDTNVISEAKQKAPNPKVMTWLDAQPESDLFLSVITIGELQRGVTRLPESHKRRALLAWLQHDLRRRFEERILPITDQVATAWGNAMAEAEQNGHPIPTLDALIAATAIVHQLTLVTRNTVDMSRAGVTVFNPWEDTY